MSSYQQAFHRTKDRELQDSVDAFLRHFGVQPTTRDDLASKYMPIAISRAVLLNPFIGSLSSDDAIWYGLGGFYQWVEERRPPKMLDAFIKNAIREGFRQKLREQGRNISTETPASRDSDKTLGDVLAHPNPYPGHWLEMSEAENALQQLPERWREILEADADGIRQADIAARFGISQPRVNQILRKARAQLNTN